MKTAQMVLQKDLMGSFFCSLAPESQFPVALEQCLMTYNCKRETFISSNILIIFFLFLRDSGKFCSIGICCCAKDFPRRRLCRRKLSRGAYCKGKRPLSSPLLLKICSLTYILLPCSYYKRICLRLLAFCFSIRRCILECIRLFLDCFSSTTPF
jgi:hypothetical protein